MIGFRQLGPGDAEAAAPVHRLSFDERLPWLAGLHTPDEDRRFFRDRVLRECTVWGAVAGEALVGIIAFRAEWVDQLYLLPQWQGRGLGGSLLEIAKRRERRLSLWTFQRNAGARRFYERHGFTAIELTDGSGNEEREPDVLFRWSAEARGERA